MKPLTHSALILLAFVVFPTLAWGQAKPDRKPNVLFIAVDDLNHWVGYLGRNEQTRTPNIDKLAARGVSFSRSYCAAPVCNPSRAALMSGLRPATTGVYDNNNDWRPVVSPEKCLPATFRNAGYVAYGAGKIYHGGFDRKEEWNEYLKNEGPEPKPKGNDGVGGIKFAPLDCKDEDLADYRIADWCIDKLRQKQDKPFFLSCGFHKPHMPWNVPQKWYDKFPLESIKLPPHIEGDLKDVPPAGVKMAKPEGDHAAILASGRWKDAVQGYLAAIAYCDMNVGRLIDALDKSEYRDNTIIVFWGDHGWHLGEKEHWRKFALWEESTRAPLIWVAPGVTKAGLCERTVDFMSIYPTLTDLCGIPTPTHVEGKSIRALLENPKAEWNTPAMTTFHFNNHAVRSEGWRYIRYADGGEELYDEAKDPLEYTNVAGHTENAKIKAELGKVMPTKNQPDAADKATGGAGKGKGKKKAADE
ncbi:sulfatase [Humisphaera borealis]|uniref:Sulfatase n=1 Tax=Humisphaera borealis TaxID=2807512 RepID=A0A7M2WRG4_9BACT|nr:sulfatase [Humisphaera borealis]QOV88066.1 sulfatase [Humisphaera borealis]